MVMEEVDQVFGGDAERPCSTQDAAQLKYLECCIKETLRLYPSVPAVMRSLTEDIDIGNSIVENKNCVILDKPPLASRWP
jgi:cytochrome P450 family 4